MSIAVAGQLLNVTFQQFGLEEYNLFLKTKKLPEKQVTYDWETDTYTLTTPARFAGHLGAEVPSQSGNTIPVAGHLMDYQQWALSLALEARRFALWADTGLGKTIVYLEWARHVRSLTIGRVLILAPLQVIPQAMEEYAGWYPDGEPTVHLQTRADLIDWLSGNGPDAMIGFANYEKFIPGTISELRLLAGLVADESSILRTGGGTIKWNLIKSARGIEYKLSCTATPAPNEAMEYASQAAFLEKLRSEGDILWTYFQRDKYGVWAVKPHAREAFYRFMASWSLYIRDPATFGFNDILSSLPIPVMVDERISATDEQRSAMQEILIRRGYGLFIDERVPITIRGKLAQLARGFMYETVDGRKSARHVQSLKPERVAEIISQEIASGRKVLVWTSFDEEGEIIHDLLGLAGGTVAILHGKHSQDERLDILNRFKVGDIQAVISKPQLIGYGLNLQHVESMVFSGVDDSFERRYQAIRRAYRYGQTKTVRVFTPYIPELESVMFDNVAQKELRFLEEVTAQEQQYRRAFNLEAA